MPVILKSFPAKNRVQHGDLTQYLDGKIRRFKPKEIQNLTTFRIRLYQEASKLSGKVRTKRIGGDLIVQFQKGE